MRVALAVLLLGLRVATCLYMALHWRYSSGERAGWIQKLSDKGRVCKTREGEPALVSMPGTATVEKFAFTVVDAMVAAETVKVVGKRVNLRCEKKVGLPTACFGETRHFVTAVSESSEISISPGVVVPTDAAGTATPAAAR